MKRFIILITVFYCLSIQGYAQSHGRYSLPKGALGGYPHTTKGGVALTIYSPTDSRGLSITQQPLYWWTDLAWNGNDAPYALARRQLDEATKRGVLASVLVQRTRKKLDAKPYDSLRTYRWVYASWLARHAAANKSESDQIFFPVNEYFAEVRFPGSYEYARMGFFVLAYNAPNIVLKPLAERLLRRKPDDEAVKFYLARILPTGNTKDDDARALAILRQFQHKYPNDIQYDRQYAKTLQYFWSRHYPLLQSRATTAINAWKLVLNKAPLKIDRDLASARIRSITQQQADWERWDKKGWEKEKAEGKRAD